MLQNDMAVTLFSTFALFIMTQSDDFPVNNTIGQTWPVIEQSALSEIEARAKNTPVDMSVFGDSDNWEATQSRELPAAQFAVTRTVTPFHTLSFDIPDRDGGILYPKGYVFNPLQYANLPGRIIVVRPEHIRWALKISDERDMILVSGGNVLKLHGEGPVKSLFRLDPGLADKMDLMVAPTIVSQSGATLKLEEIPASIAEMMIEGAIQ